MYSIIKENNRSQYNLAEFVADTENDVKDLPIDVCPGSTCIVIGTGDVWMLTHNKEWKKI